MPNKNGMGREMYNAWFRIYYRKNAEKLRAYKRQYNQEWRRKSGYSNEIKSQLRYPNKVLARQKFYLAFSRGEIKKENCKVCGAKDIQAHHTDYNQPLQVVWLCRIHHMRQHPREKSDIPDEVILAYLQKAQKRINEKKKLQRKRHRMILVLRSKGSSYAEIAKKLNITRQRAHQIYAKYKRSYPLDEH